jgi:hypothetical protein
MTKRILIIGSNGYIGSRLVEFLLFRTDYSITTVSNYYYEFNLFKSSRLVSFQCDQRYYPSECIRDFDVVISFAPKYESLIHYLQPEQTFIFTDPRYLFSIQNLFPRNETVQQFSFNYYHLELINVNGFSPVLDLSKSINYNIYLYKNNRIPVVPLYNNENFLGILDFCRCIESFIIFGRLSLSGSYKLCSSLPNNLPFHFIYQDTYNTIVTEILENWNSILQIKNPKPCLICSCPTKVVYWNSDYVVCKNCFHIQRKHTIKWDEPQEQQRNNDNEKDNDNDNDNGNDNGNDRDNDNGNDNGHSDGHVNIDEIITHFLSRYSLCRENLVNSQNILILTPKILPKRWQGILNRVLKSLSQNSNLSVVYSSFVYSSTVHSLFDIIFIPDGIQMIENPYMNFRLISNKLFDNGKIILKTASTIPFLSPIDLSSYITSNNVSFYNTYSLRLLVEKYSLYINKCDYTDAGENILCLISKKNNCISSCVNDCSIYEIENNIYDQYSY